MMQAVLSVSQVKILCTINRGGATGGLEETFSPLPHSSQSSFL